MSPGRAAGDSAGDLPPQWIGTAQRESAAWALDEHFTANRLTLGEYADRSECVVQATLASELSALFVDLPPPHPVLPNPTTPQLDPPPARPRWTRWPALRR